MAEKTSEKAKKAKASQKVRVGQYKEYVRLVHVAQMRFAKVRFAPKYARERWEAKAPCVLEQEVRSVCK